MRSLVFLFLGLLFSCNSTGQPDLGKAIATGDIETVQTFISNTLVIDDTHIRDTYTPLNFAIKTGQIEIVKLLLENKANTEIASNGKTPLIYAAKYGRVEIAKLLLENGANKSFENRKKRTALDYAKKYEQPAMVKFLNQE